MRSSLGNLKDIERGDKLANPVAIFDELSSQDWSFTDSDTQVSTHNLHPYPAKFIPQIPAKVINRLSLPGDLVCDPFGGCGTSAVEAVRLGRRALSCDANPLSALIGRTKVGFMSPDVDDDVQHLRALIADHLQNQAISNENWLSDEQRTYRDTCPPIPNIEKWFTPQVTTELCVLKGLIAQAETQLGHDIANTALSRIITKVSNQESETRYVAVPQHSVPGQTLQAYLESIEVVSKTLANSANELHLADARFVVGDSRHELPQVTGGELVDLIITSPPYSNATDYHLYHRFRMFWLGYDPRELGRIEIGSHLRHQRNQTGFGEYSDEMALTLAGCHQILAPGRFAVFVVADARFKGQQYHTADTILSLAQEVGFAPLGTIQRPVHRTKRSFPNAGRRTATEQLVVLQKPNYGIRVQLNPPDYRMWEHEKRLRAAEIEAITGNAIEPSEASGRLDLKLVQPELWATRRLAFTKSVATEDSPDQPFATWQNSLENAYNDPSRRKNPQYATHGLHPFKGKFYPQLAKALLNISGTPVGGRIFDPYCGSGTTLLEGMLNGFTTYGCDLNPLAVKISLAKTCVLTTPRNAVEQALAALIRQLDNDENLNAQNLDEFPSETHPELVKWFSEPILFRLNNLLRTIRQIKDPAVVEFAEVIASSLVREISEQDPTDLRTRRRKVHLDDAPVSAMFRQRLDQAHQHLRRYWAVAGRQPGRIIPPAILHGDSRDPATTERLGLGPSSLDCVLTSPPFATALPYIDTDRLSLLAIMGITRTRRTKIDRNLTGSREITSVARTSAEATLLSAEATLLLPAEVVGQIRQIHYANQLTDVGFRRANMSALLWRYFTDIKATLEQIKLAMKPGASAFYLVGDNRTKAGDSWVRIATGAHIKSIAEVVGLRHVNSEEITVTTENYRHIKNAITRNHVLQFVNI